MNRSESTDSVSAAASRKRAHPDAKSVVSCSSTESSLSDSFASTTSTSQTGFEGWMYWKRDQDCWMKVYVVVRKHSLWLTRSAASSSLASPLIQVAVARVERTTGRGFHVTGPSGELMELYAYADEQLWACHDALEEAANCMWQSLEHRVLERRRTASHSIVRRLSSSVPSIGRTRMERSYRGTLVAYNEERRGNRWKRFWRSLGIGEALRKHVEEAVDRLDTPSSAIRTV